MDGKGAASSMRAIRSGRFLGGNGQMECRYCGATNPRGGMRCVKCQRRIVTHEYPVFETAAVPQLQPQEGPPRLRFGEIPGNPQAAKRKPAIQQPLFAYREQEKVMTLPGPPPAPRSRTSRPSEPARPRRRASENQIAFDFTSPAPSQPFTREMVRRDDRPVAPLTIRAAAAAIDSAIVMGFSAALTAIVRLLLGEQLPFHAGLAPYGIAMVLSVGLCYKLIWCLFCQPTIGLQLLGLRVVGFNGQLPTLGQCIVRILSGWLSFASVGMGLAWAVVDAEQLTWHDHISQSYLALDR